MYCINFICIVNVTVMRPFVVSPSVLKSQNVDYFDSVYIGILFLRNVLSTLTFIWCQQRDGISTPTFQLQIVSRHLSFDQQFWAPFEAYSKKRTDCGLCHYGPIRTFSKHYSSNSWEMNTNLKAPKTIKRQYPLQAEWKIYRISAQA